MWKKGEITVLVSLLLAVLLFLLEACLWSARYALLRSQAEEALELAETSVLSEYHRELLERYDLFYVDLGYGTGQEDTEYLKQRLRWFLLENLSEGSRAALEVWDFSRASDERGMAYYEQAVSHEKQATGAALVERLLHCGGLAEVAEERYEAYSEADGREQRNLEELRRRREEIEEVSTPDPVSSTEALKAGSILHLVLTDPGKVSGKKADLTQAPSVRSCLEGVGPRGFYEGSIGNDLFFHAYLMEHFSHAVEFLTEGREEEPWLDYQLEYLIAGEDTDIANLERVCNRILLMREGMNYAYLQTDSAKKAECEALALLMVGATMIPGLVEAVKQVLMLAWAFGESVMDVRVLLSGKKCAFYKSGGRWRTSLSGALDLSNSISGFDSGEDAQGLSYEDYLGILLTATGREKKTMRSLDAMEGVIRRLSGNSGFYVDQCTDGFRLRAVIANGRELTAERSFCYEW